MPVPMFKLPLLCVEGILYEADIHDLIVFSTLSKVCLRLVASLRKSIKEISVECYTSDFTTVQFRTANLKIRGVWKFRNTNGEEAMAIRKKNGKVKHYPQLGTPNSSRMPVMNGLGYLKTLFKLPIHRISFNYDEIPKELISLLTENTNIVSIKGKQVISGEQFATLLETTNTDWLLLLQPFEQDFSFDPEKITFSHFGYMNQCSRITWNSLLQLDLRTLTLKSNELNPQDCYSFVQDWLSSDSTHFRSIFLNLTGNADFSNTFNSLETVPWCSTRRSQCFVNQNLFAVDCENALDIQRKDGLWASIRVWSSTFFFGVWHNSFHNVGKFRVI